MSKSVTFEYLPGDSVYIRALDSYGWVEAVVLLRVVGTAVACVYRVEYWWEGKMESVELRGDQLDACKERRAPYGDDCGLGE